MSLAKISYDINLPFQLSLTDEDDVVHCLEKVRVIPNKRLVCKGSWRGQAVYVKIFAATTTAHRDCQREVDGSKALTQHNIAAAQIIYQGQLPEQHTYIVIYGSIEPAVVLDDAWQTADLEEKRDLLQNLTQVVAQHHEEGIHQQDMHLGNFIRSDDVIYTVDAADIQIHKDKLNKRDSFTNLSLLFAQISPLHDDLARTAFKLYTQLRGWQSSGSQLDAFMNSVGKVRRTRKEKYLKKIFRETSAFISGNSLMEFNVYDRSFDGEDVRQILQDPDACIEAGEIIKQGNTCTVASVESELGTLIIKRYNIKNSWHAMRRALAQTRASISWRNAHRLQLYQITSAQPVALLERCFGPVHFQSYFVMGEVKGPSCWEYFEDPAVSMHDKENVAVGISDLFELLRFHKISHGDMKATNLIINNYQPILLDLDAMREHTSSFTFKKAHASDMQRFLQNWQDRPDIFALFQNTFNRAGIQV